MCCFVCGGIWCDFCSHVKFRNEQAGEWRKKNQIEIVNTLECFSYFVGCARTRGAKRRNEQIKTHIKCKNYFQMLWTELNWTIRPSRTKIVQEFDEIKANKCIKWMFPFCQPCETGEKKKNERTNKQTNTELYRVRCTSKCKRFSAQIANCVRKIGELFFNKL